MGRHLDLVTVGIRQAQRVVHQLYEVAVRVVDVGVVLTAVFTLITKAMDGQTADQKAQMWAWFVEDQTRLRKFFHIGE